MTEEIFNGIFQHTGNSSHPRGEMLQMQLKISA